MRSRLFWETWVVIICSLRHNWCVGYCYLWADPGYFFLFPLSLKYFSNLSYFLILWKSIGHLRNVLLMLTTTSDVMSLWGHQLVMIGYTQMIKWLRRNPWQKNITSFHCCSPRRVLSCSFNKIIGHTASLVTGDHVDPNTVLFIY